MTLLRENKMFAMFRFLHTFLPCAGNTLHRTKSHVSAFPKCDGNIELHVSATFTLCGNVLYQVSAILSSFRHVSGTEMSSNVSVIFKSN